MMKIRLFATLKERAGRPEIEVHVADGATIAELRVRIAAEFPPLAALVARSVVAVNHEFAFDHDTLRANDEVALFPPVSGG